MRRVIYTCTVCGTEKKETNHWFMADASMNTTCATPDQQRVVFRLWWEERAADFDHLCGQACAQKYLERFLGRLMSQ